jgi:hypothetical protein
MIVVVNAASITSNKTLMENHDDEYSYHFSIEFDDGQELSESIDSRYKNSDEESYALGRVSMIYQEANVKLVGVGRNY